LKFVRLIVDGSALGNPGVGSLCSTASCGSSLKAQLRRTKCAGPGCLGTARKNQTTTGRIRSHARPHWLLRREGRLSLLLSVPVPRAHRVIVALATSQV